MFFFYIELLDNILCFITSRKLDIKKKNVNEYNLISKIDVFLVEKKRNTSTGTKQL